MTALLARRSHAQIEAGLVTNLQDLAALAPEWQRLWAGSEHGSAFTAPGWLLAWWRHLGGGELRVFTVRAGGRLVGLLPMFIHADAGVARLLPLGISVSDRFDLLAAPGWSCWVAESLAHRLRDRSGGWDACELHEAPSGSPLRQFATSSFVQSVSPVLDLNGFAALPARSGARRRLARARRAAEAAGLTLDRPGPEALEDLFRLHEMQWAGRGQPGVLTRPQVQDFHREAAKALAETGTVRFQRLLDGPRTVGVLYGFQHRGREAAYASGIDPAYAALGLGTVLVGGAIAAAWEDGRTQFDFLRGPEPYKYAWGAVDEPLFRLNYPAVSPRLANPRPLLPLRHGDRAGSLVTAGWGGP